MKNIYILFIAIFTLNSVSCTKKQGPVEPEIIISTVSFKDDIQPIFNSHCISCHKASLEQSFGELNLEADKSYEELVNTDAFIDATVKRVTPNNATNSVLWQKINTSELYGTNMPLGADPLTQYNQNLIETWINEGAQNN